MWRLSRFRIEGKIQITRAGAYDGSAVSAWLDHPDAVATRTMQRRLEDRGKSPEQTATERRGGP